MRAAERVATRLSSGTSEPDLAKQENQMLPRRQLTAFARFYRSARNNDILDQRTTVLIHLAAAMASGCYP